MLLGKLSGNITTKEFQFEAEARVKKLDYISLKDPTGQWILAYIDTITRIGEKTVVSAEVIGYRDKRSFLKTPNEPFATGTPVYAAEEDFIKETLGLEQKGLYMGLLEGYNIKVHLPVERLIKKHIAVLAKTGAGKSYATAVLMEELAENDIPAVILDPHGEYSTLKYENKKPNELKLMERFGIRPKSYSSQMLVFNTGSNPIKLNGKLSAQDIIQMLPAKISASQKGILYSAIRNLEGKEYVLRDVIEEIQALKSQVKWNLVSMLEFLSSTKLFSANPTKPEEIVKRGKVTIIDMKEEKPETQQIIVTKVLEELFEARKRDKIPPFLMVVEEAHNFCPERGFGEVASSKIMRTIASEGRKFGFGLCVVTQRPARIDKNILSQCNTQLILKVTNPNDVKAIMDSVEGIGKGSREEIKDLPVGVAMIVGISDQPFIVNIRIRRSEHGGEAIKVEGTKPKETLLFFQPNFTQADIEREYKGIEGLTFLNYPLWRIKSRYKDTDLELFIDGITGEILFQSEGYIERSQGIKELLELSPSNRLIVSYLIAKKFSSIEKIAEDLKMPLSTVQTNVKDLLGKGLLTTDGYMIRNKINYKLPQSLLNTKIMQKVVKGSKDGQMLDFLVSEDFARKVADLWKLDVSQIEAIYYPYYLVKNKDQQALVDAVNKKLDIQTIKIISKMV